MNDMLKKYRLHLFVFWALLFAAWYFLRAADYASSKTAFWVTLVKVADLALMVCICNYVLIPKLFYKKKYVLFVLCFVAMVVASSMLKMQLLGKIMNNQFLLDWTSGWRQKIYDNIIPHFFLVIAGAAIKLMIDSVLMQKKMAAIAKENAETELLYLKQQINPHFLFNALNSVYFQIDKSNIDARKSLHTFSEMLRYQLYEAGQKLIPVEKEIQYLKDYIAIQQIRNDKECTISFSVSQNVAGFSIEPFLLLPFVENCFKHISHFTDKQNYIHISLTQENEFLIFKAVNSFDNAEPAATHSGIGLSNVKRRLQLLYPTHTISVDKKGSEFIVYLKIPTNEK